MHGAANVDRGAGHGHGILLHLMPGQGDVAGRRLNQAIVDHRTGAAAGFERGGHFVATGGRAQVAAGADSATDVKAVTGGQRGLAFGGDDGTGVLHFAAEQQRITTRIGGRCRLVGFDKGTALHQYFAGGIGKGRLTAGGVHIQAALTELYVGDRRGGGHQVAHVDLAGATEHDAVAVDQHHRAVALDLPLDLTGARTRVVDAVKHRPVRLLLEVHGGIAPDVEGFPVENRLVGGLLDLHRGLAIGLTLLRRLGIGPALGQAVVDFQTALAQPIRHRLHPPERGLPPRRLRGLLRGNRSHGVVEVGQ